MAEAASRHGAAIPVAPVTETLKRVAELTGGAYSPAESSGELEKVFADLPTSLITRYEVIEVGALFVAVATLFAGAAFLLARLWRPLP